MKWQEAHANVKCDTTQCSRASRQVLPRSGHATEMDMLPTRLATHCGGIGCSGVGVVETNTTRKADIVGSGEVAR